MVDDRTGKRFLSVRQELFIERKKIRIFATTDTKTEWLLASRSTLGSDEETLSGEDAEEKFCSK